MSNRNKIITFILIAIILLVVAMYYFLKGYIPKYRWNDDYGYKSEQPYGLKLMYDILSNAHPKSNFVQVNNAPKNYFNQHDSTSLYVFIGASFYADSINSESFMKFVNRGNSVFISGINTTHYLFTHLTNGLRPVIYPTNYYDSIVTVTFTNIDQDSSFRFHYKVADKLRNRSWMSFEKALIKDSLSWYGFQEVSHIERGLVDCFRVKWGKGWFIFHFNPIWFTNYNLSKENGLKYVNTLLSEYKQQKIYWDEFSKIPLEKSFGSSSSHESPLRFILSERSLRWTWYLICLTVLLFIIFNSKRKQASIPLIPANKNTTIEYITAIATLHYQNNSLDFLAEEMMKQFLSFVKHKYGISPQLEKNEIARQLAPISGIPEETLQTLFKRYLDVKYLPDVKYLIEFYNLTEYFYQKCK